MTEDRVRSIVARGTVLVLTVLGAGLRLAFLGQPMRLDEVANYTLTASKPVAAMVKGYLPNNHVLHTLLVHWVTGVFGGSPWCIRAVAFASGVALVPLTYATAAEFVDRETGLLAAALVAASSPLIEFSTDARGYTLQAVMVLAVFFSAAKLLRTSDRKWWAALTAAAALGFATIPTMVFFFAGALGWLVLSGARGDARAGFKPLLVRIVAVGALVALLAVLTYLPFVLGSGLAAVTHNRWTQSLGWSEYAAALGPSVRDDVVSWHRGLPLPVSILFGVGAVASLAAFPRVSRFKVNPVPTALGCALLLTAVQRVTPPERVWVPLVPLYLVAVATGWRWLATRSSSLGVWWEERRFGPVAPAAVIVLAGAGAGTCVLVSNSPYQTPDQVTFRDAEPLTEILAGILRDGDIVYVQWDAAYVLEYYFDRHDISPRYVYRAGKPYSGVSRAFAIDAHTDYQAFTYQEAVNASNLARTREYEAVVIAQLPDSTLYQVMSPELAEAR